MKEAWKPVVGYETRYHVSNLGRVKSLGGVKRVCGNGVQAFSPRILKQSNAQGYKYVNLCNGSCKPKKIHRLVADAFIPNPLNKKCINHIDGNKSNNTVSNLEWCNHSENLNHAYKTGLRKPVKQKIEASPARKEIMDVETNRIYPSVNELVRLLGMPRTTFNRKLKKGLLNNYKLL